MPLLLPLSGAGAAASMPSRLLEIAFDTAPDVAPAWTDVTAYLRDLTIIRGRSREADQYQAGHMTVTLDNRDRRFDPSFGTNYLSVQGAGFETAGSVGGWTDLGFAILTQTTAQAKSGTGALSAKNNGGTLLYSIRSELVRVVEGRTYGFTVSSRAATTGRSFTVTLRFWNNASRTTLLDSVSDTDTDSTVAWTTANGSMVGPVGAAWADLLVSWSSPGAAEVHYLDEAGILDDTTTWSVPGPHTGKVLPMKRIRFTADGQVQFDGYVDSWDMEFDNPNEARAVVSATDAFKVLAVGKLKSSVYTQEVSGDAPKYWFRLGEPVGSTTIADTQQAIPGTVVGTATFGQTGLAGDGDTAVTMANANSGIRVTDPRAQWQGSGSFSVEALIKTTEAATEVIWQQDGTSSAQMRLRMLGTGILEFQLTGAGSAFTAETESTSAVNNGQTRHVCVTFNSTTNDLRVYVDGVNNSNIVLAGVGTYFVNGFQVTLGNDKSFLVNGWNGTLDEVAVYERELSSTEVAGHASAVLTPWVGDLPGARFTRVLDAVSFPTFLRSIDTGQTTLQAANLAEAALTHLQTTTNSEFGEFYITRDGLVRFVERIKLVNQVSGGTFGEGAGQHRYAEVTFDYSDQLIRNDVTVNRVNGVAQTVKNAASITAFLQHSYERTGLFHNSDVHSRNAAEFLVSQYKDPLLRVTSIKILPQRNPANLFPVVLARELGDKITVTNTPPGGGSNISQDVRIEGISHRVTPKFWETTWQLSSAYAGVCYFELDDGAGSAPCGLDDAALYF